MLPDNFSGPRDRDPRYLRLVDPCDSTCVEWYDAASDRTGGWVCHRTSGSRLREEPVLPSESWEFVPYPPAGRDDLYIRRAFAAEIAAGRRK